jgi:hypothetical protein
VKTYRGVAVFLVLFVALRLIFHSLDPRQLDLIGSVPPHRRNSEGQETGFSPR